MPIIKKQYFVKGVDNQKSADITFQLNRVEISKLQDLNNNDKLLIVEFLNDCKKDIQLNIDRLSI